MPSAPRPRRLRRWLVRFGVLLLLLGVGVWFAPVVVAKTGLRNAVLARSAANLKGTLTAGDASFGWLSPVELRDVRVADADGRTLLTAPKVTSSKTLLALAGDQLDLGTFTVEQPVVEVVCSPTTTNVEDALANYLTGESAGGRPAVAVVVTGGRVVLKEAGRDGEHAIEGVEATVTVPRTGAVVVAVATKQLDADLALGDEVTGRLKATGFAVETLAPLAARFAPGTAVAGKLTADVSGRWAKDRGAVEGRVAVADLDLSAPWLGPDRVRLAHADLPLKAALAGDAVTVEHAALTCDAGTASVAGVVSLSEPVEKLLARPGLKLEADLDAAKLAAVVPRLLRLRDGMELRGGRLTASVTSTADDAGTRWAGHVSTTAIKGTHAGKLVAWEHPLTATFAGRLRPDGLPVFDKLECQSDFVGLAARGDPETFVAAANVDLDRLSARLADFVDLGGVTLAGAAELKVNTAPRPGGGFAATATARLTRFAFAEPGRALHEPELTVALKASGSVGANGAVRIDAGDATVTAAGDQLVVALVEPVADLKAARTGKASARVTGDFARWRNRVGAWAGIPKDWDVGGAGTVAGVVTLTDAGATVEKATADLTSARFRGAGVEFAEPTLKAEAGVAWDRKTNSVAFTDVRASCDTAGVAAKRLDLKPAGDTYALSGTALVNANVNRVQRALKLQTDPAGGDALAGLAKGTVTFDTADPVKFTADLVVDKFSYGPPAKPTWSEPAVKVVAAGEYAGDAVQLTHARVDRDGFAVEAKGRVAKLSTVQELDLSGTFAYDLGKVEPHVRAYLGHGGQLRGLGTKPFRLAGSLADGGKSVAMTVGRSASQYGGLTGNAAVGWDAVKAYGFDVGPAELKAAIDRGTVKLDPVEATFGGGKVRVEPSLSLASKDYDLTFARGRVVDRARLTPAACANALGYALPAVANAAQADGLVSLELEDARVPLADPDRAAVKGKLILHAATLTPGPLVTEVVALLGTKAPTLHLAAEQVVAVRVENGRVHHENFALTFGTTTVRTSGSVGLDRSVALVVDVPMPGRVLDKLLANNPRLRESLAKQRLKVPVGGTLARPRLDAKAFEASAEQVVRAALADAAKSAADEAIRKAQQELLKKLGGKK